VCEYVVDLERALFSGWYILHNERRTVQHLPLSNHINMMRYFLTWFVNKSNLRSLYLFTQSSVKHGYFSIANTIPTWYFRGVECLQDFRFEKRQGL